MRNQDFLYFTDLHRILFSDIYEWAGKIRNVDISLGDTRFCSCARIGSEAEKLFGYLQRSEYFTDLSKTLLIGKCSEFYSDLNALHPFRDGNGRTQRILFEHIVLNCGYSISWESVSRQEWIDANIEGFSGRNQAMTEIFAKCIGKELRE